MQSYKGYVSSVIFRNKTNLYTVFEFRTQDSEFTCTGYPPAIAEGESAEIEAETVNHPVYGEQLKVSSYRAVPPEGEDAIYRYLASGAVKGIGPALAMRILKKFGEDTLRILNEEPERLAEVKGISARTAREIAARLEGQRETRDALIFLQQYGIGGRRAVKIWETYGPEMYTVLKDNPYRLAEDIDGIGFTTADEIAARSGIRADDDFRVRSGIQFVLSETLREGSTWIPRHLLIEKAGNLLKVEEETIRRHLDVLAAEGKLKILSPSGRGGQETGGFPGPAQECRQTDDLQVYSAAAYRLEQRIACRLLQLDERPARTWPEHELALRIRRLEESSDIHLDDLQRRAVELSASRGVLLLSGGPGTGKTTTIRSIIRLFRSDARPVVLAAPTGRAAKRMTEATGQEAMTIHRLLECRGSAGEGKETGGDQREGAWYFDRNEQNPLEADAVIIDEMSMVDLYLFDALLRAVPQGTALILVGDMNQLPSVGPGRVFGDLMESGQFEAIVLQKIFRQAQESDIVMNAHRILQGEPLVLDNHSKDFFLLERKDPQVIYKHTVMLLRDKLPSYTGAAREEIQVLTPMRRGPLGAARLNEVLQSVLNPPQDGREEITAHDATFRVGDKVMQTRNNYRIEWEIPGQYGMAKERGEGIFNGDFGVIVGIDRAAGELEIRFDEDRMVRYPAAELEDLDLAYAITVHKSQGSEYPAVIVPLLDGPPALMNRSLLYTAVTRAKYCVVILGSAQTVRRMEENIRESERRTGLKERLLEIPKAP